MTEKEQHSEIANLLVSMNHELRTPLNGIIGFTETLLMGLPGPINSEQEGQLNIIKVSSKQLLSALNDLSYIAKIVSGKISPNYEKVNCRLLLEEINALYSAPVKEKGLQWLINTSQEDLYISTDKSILSKIIVNLINNAIQFTDKGTITIELTKKQKDGKEYIHINVIDTGSGIKPEDQHKLFQPFQKFHSQKQFQVGNGLGLYLSLKMAEQIHGRIEYESNDGRGSQFRILLPA